MIFDVNGNSLRNAATVLGAASSSSRSRNEKDPAVIRSTLRAYEVGAGKAWEDSRLIRGLAERAETRFDVAGDITERRNGDGAPRFA